MRKSVLPKKLYLWQEHFIKNLALYNILVGPRQHGKTELLSEILKSIIYSSSIENPVVNLCSDTQARIIKLYGSRLKAMFSVHPDFSLPSVGKSIIRFRRTQGDFATINLFGARQNPKGPEGTTSNLNIVDECGTVSRAFIKETLMPTADHTGGPTILAGTVDAGDFLELFKEAESAMSKPNSPWFVFDFKLGDKWSRECRTDRQIEVIKARYNMENPDDVVQYKKMYLCDWFAGLSGTPFAGAYLSARADKRIGKFPYDSRFGVGTTWDNGLGYMAVWFWQLVDNRPRFIGFKLWKDTSIKEACADIKKWYHDKKARATQHIFPHTMWTRSAYSGQRLYKQTMKALNDNGTYVRIRRVANIDQKIETSVRVMSFCVFDEESCFQGLTSLQKYRRIENLLTKTRSKGIVKDMHSHGAEAFTEFCIGFSNSMLFDRANLGSRVIYINNGGIIPPVGFKKVTAANTLL